VASEWNLSRPAWGATVAYESVMAAKPRRARTAHGSGKQRPAHASGPVPKERAKLSWTLAKRSHAETSCSNLTN